MGATKCACKGSSCLWTLGKKPVDDLFCIKRNMCEHPKHYLTKLPSSLHDKIVCDAEAQHGGLFLEAETSCRFNCGKVTAKVAGGITCQCESDGFCNWYTDIERRPKVLKSTQAI